MGTPGYQAPELLLGKVPTAACDVYSLGLLFWQLDSREVPYARQHPQVYHVTEVAIEVYQAIKVTNHPTFHQHFHSDLYIASEVHYQAVMWSVVAVDARPTVPPQERAAVGL